MMKQAMVTFGKQEVQSKIIEEMSVDNKKAKVRISTLREEIGDIKPTEVAEKSLISPSTQKLKSAKVC